MEVGVCGSMSTVPTSPFLLNFLLYREKKIQILGCTIDLYSLTSYYNLQFKWVKQNLFR